MDENNQQQNEGVKFSKEALIKSMLFEERKDAVDVVIKENEYLTIEEVELKINEFMKGKVN